MGERTRGRFPNRGEEEEDERGRFSCLGPAGDVKKGVAGSRFVGNSFLLFEPVFSLARRLYISAPLPLSPNTREQTFGELDLAIDRTNYS